jgi:hypothetical protein
MTDMHRPSAAPTYLPAGYPQDAAERLRRLRSFAWLLDEAIPLPGGFRVGLDALIGLVPGLGDALGALISTYMINEARYLGAPRRVLARMMINVLIETIVGAVPVAGDLFDAAFKANMRNIALLERHHAEPTRKHARDGWFVAGFFVLLLAIVTAVIALPVLVVVGIVSLF